jgi:hypothetical protein
MDRLFEPKAVRYIKLGRGGMWAAEAIEVGIIPFGYPDIDHAPCADGDWQTVRARLIESGRTPAGASHGVRELRDFYELDGDTLWVTVADGHLWWTFAEGPVVLVEDRRPDGPGRLRRTRDGWRRESLNGEPLTTRSLSSALTRTANYRMTICAVDREDYLLRRIRGEEDPLHAEAKALRARMRELGLRMIRQLHWEEFETLVDLIFAHSGWRRSSVLGRNQPDVDLILDQPATGETAWVQVKSGTDQAELDDYHERFRRDGSCDRFFFVCHSPKGALRLPDERHLHLWYGEALSGTAIDAGLFDWLMDRTR